jgi:hypothetical protein
MIGRWLAMLVAAALGALGTGALAAPRAAAAGYGIVIGDPRARALIRAMGIRDAALGVVLALLLLQGADAAAGWAMLALAAVALADLALVTADRRKSGRGRDAARWLHAAGAIVLLTASVLLRAGR